MKKQDEFDNKCFHDGTRNIALHIAENNYVGMLLTRLSNVEILFTLKFSCNFRKIICEISRMSHVI